MLFEGWFELIPGLTSYVRMRDKSSTVSAYLNYGLRCTHATADMPLYASPSVINLTIYSESAQLLNQVRV